MKIAYVFNHAYFLGGGEISLTELIKSVDKNLVDPVIFVPEHGEIEDESHQRVWKIRVVSFPPLKQIIPFRPISALLRLIRTFRTSRIELIHVNGSRACFYCIIAGRILGIPVIWHVRETAVDLYLYDGLLCLLSNLMICVSRSVKYKRFTRFGKIFDNKILVLYNSVNTAIFKKKEHSRNTVRRKLGLDEEILFGAIANIEPLKGQDFFLKAFAKAKNRMPGSPMKLLLIGRILDSSYGKELNALINELELKEDVKLLGYRHDVQDILSALDVFVLTSKREGFSRSLLEAMSVGLPILATRISEIEEAVCEHRNALLVNYDDVGGLASAIIKIAKDETLRKLMGESNRKRAIENFDLATHTRSIEKIYAKLAFPKS